MIIGNEGAMQNVDDLNPYRLFLSSFRLCPFATK